MNSPSASCHLLEKYGEKAQKQGVFGHRRRAEQGTIRSVFPFSFFAFFPHEDLEGAVKSF